MYLISCAWYVIDVFVVLPCRKPGRLACWTCDNTTSPNDPSCRWQYCTNSDVRVHSP